MRSIFRTLSLLLFCLYIHEASSAQMKQVYVDSDSTNHIKKIHFYSPTEGYVAFTKWIGFTQDGGKTFTKKYITQIIMDGASLNLGLGFSIAGVYAFDKKTVLVYGDLSGKPCILYSNDATNTFTMVYLGPFDTNNIFDHINDIDFPSNQDVGFAVNDTKILKSYNKGASWLVVNTSSYSHYSKIKFVSSSVGFTADAAGIYKTQNEGNYWFRLPHAPGDVVAFDFTDETHGWMTLLKDQKYLLYATTDGGLTWQLQNDGLHYAVRRGSLVFVNDSTGYSTGNLFDLIKTTDSGKTWELVERDNAYEFLGYGLEDVFAYDQNTLWAGGDHGFLEASTNGGGTTLPSAYFEADLTQLQTTGKVLLSNQSKSNYTFKWFKNGVLLATTYNTAYTSNWRTVDTIKLVGIKGTHSDTAVQIIDTRVNEVPCVGTFTAKQTPPL